MNDLLCPLCGAGARRRLRWPGGYDLCSCSSCETLFADPMPDDERLREFYQGFLFRRPAPERLRRLIARRQAELRRLFGSRLCRGASFLDFGGGTGVASLAAEGLDLRVVYHEIDGEAVAHVREIAEGLDVEIATAFAPLSGRQFDLIFADNVIEHVRDPIGLVARLYGLLAPGGTLVFKTPRARNLELLFRPKVIFGNYLRKAAAANGVRGAVAAALISAPLIRFFA